MNEIMNKLTTKEKMLLEGLEARYGTEALTDAINAAAAQAEAAPSDENAVSVISVKEAILRYIQFLEGCHTRIKELHWEADHKSKHTLVDDMHDEILDYEDEIAEDMMGFLGTRIKVFEVHPIVPKAATLKELLDEIENETLTLIASVEDEQKCIGLVNILEEVMHWINKCKYLETMQ